jgi:hypothetical protein
MQYSIKTLLLYLLIPYSSVFGQQEEQQSAFSLSVAGAIPFSSPPIHRFDQSGISVNVPPGLFGSISLTYEPITLRIINPTKVSLSAELSLCELNSEEPNSSNFFSQMKLQKINAMLWTKIFIPSPFCPFVRASVGISRLKFQETYHSGYYENVSIDVITIALGLGGGVDLSISRQFILSFYGDALFTPRDIQVSHDDGTPWTTWNFGATPMLGIRATIRL